LKEGFRDFQELLTAENGVFGSNGRLFAFFFLFIIPYPTSKCKRLFGNWCKYFMNGEMASKQDTPIPLLDEQSYHTIRSHIFDNANLPLLSKKVLMNRGQALCYFQITILVLAKGLSKTDR
jgi:hypothetical protein